MPDDGVSGSPLWIPVVPETSQFGPKMQEAGQKATEGFKRGADGIGKHLRESMSQSIRDMQSNFKDLAGGLKGAMHKAGQEIRKEAPDIGREFAKSMGEEIGSALGKRAGELLEPLEDKVLEVAHSMGDKASGFIEPMLDKFKGMQGVVGNIGNSLSNAFAGLKTGDAGAGLQSVADAVKDIGTAVGAGDKVSGFIEGLQNVAGIAGGIQSGVTAFKELTTATKAAIAPTLALDAAEDANPIGAVVLAIEACVAALAALVKGVMYAYNHWGWFHDAVQKVWEVMKSVASFIKDKAVAAFDALKSAATKLWDNGIKPLWDGLKTGWETVKRDVLDPLASTFKGAFDKVKSVVEKVISWFRDKFDDLTNIIKKPLELFGKIGSHIPGVSQLGSALHLPGFAYGGPVDGPGPRGRDSILMLGAPGEHMWTADEVNKAGGHGVMYLLRALARKGLLGLPGFEGGGAVGDSRASSGAGRAIAFAHSMVGTPYSQAKRNDCSGMVSQIVNSYLGLPPRSSLMTTRNESEWLQARGFQMGVGPPGTLRVGWYNHGSAANDGHTALTLPDGENAESGGSHGNFLVGAGAAGADSPQFDHHAWLPRNPQGEPSGGIGGFGQSEGASGGGTTGSGGGGGGGAGGGKAGGGGGAPGGGGGETSPKDFGKAMAQGLMQELGLDGSVFKNPVGMPIPKMGETLFNSLTKIGQSASGASLGGNPLSGTDIGLGGLGKLVPKISSGPHVNPASTVQTDRGAGAGGPVTINNDNSFHYSGPASKQDIQEHQNASARTIPTTVVNGGVVAHGG